MFYSSKKMFTDVEFRGAKNTFLSIAVNVVVILFNDRAHFVTDVAAPRGNATLLWWESIFDLFFFSFFSPWPIVYSINIFKKRVFGWFVIFIHYFFPNKHSWSLEKKKKRNKKELVKKKIKKFISNLLI